MARHRRPQGEPTTLVFPVVVTAPGVVPGAHRAESDKAPLAHRVSAVAMAVGVVAGAGGAAAYAVTGGTFSPSAGAMNFGGFGDPDAQAVSPAAQAITEVRTVHSVDVGGEASRLLQQEQMTAAMAVNQISDAAANDYAARVKAEQERKEREAEARKPAKQREVEVWIKEAIKVLQANGTSIDNSSVGAIWTVIQKESGGNVNAINNWDSNAVRGTPSKGLMQVIDPTFQAYKLAGYDDIYRPVDNIIAGVRYVYARYGGFHNHPGLVGINAGTGYQGY
ncbi:Lytic transglycosylase catalytic [Actinosynnema mirum DSM 43827]|uniref:Lytic transglycosylase catalytic n=2 Tax=Actinosynnema TaxID=40566 RepID=C6WQS2_ACTMD|nr:Lytic transglycosylase catalytic [Actinosynnema mirum DSM 43827]